jgi:hypothetical protein
MATSSSKALRKEPRTTATAKRAAESARPPASAKASRAGAALKTPVPPKPSVAPKAIKAASVPPPANRITVDAAKGDKGGDKQELKVQLGKLSGATAQIATLKRNVSKGFYEIGGILGRIRDEKLYVVKGYGSFESFLERELDINKVSSLRMVRIAEVLKREDAIAAGFERASAAVAALDGEVEVSQASRPAGSPASALPLHKQ